MGADEMLGDYYDEPASRLWTCARLTLALVVALFVALVGVGVTLYLAEPWFASCRPMIEHGFEALPPLPPWPSLPSPSSPPPAQARIDPRRPTTSDNRMPSVRRMDDESSASAGDQLQPRWARALTAKGDSMRCRHPTPPYGRSNWRLCNDLGALRRPRLDVGGPKGIPDEGCLAVSIGIGNNWEMEDALADMGCSVHAFDPTYELHKAHLAHVHARPRTRFYFAGLGSGDPSATSAGLYGAVSASRMMPLDAILALARAGRERQAIDVLKIDCEGCEWAALADVARRAPSLLASVQHLLIELHLTPRYGLRSAEPLNALMGHLVDANGFRLFRRPRKNRGFPWARNETLPSLARAGLDPVSCCTELHFARPDHTNAFRSHAAWLARMEPAYVEVQAAAAADHGGGGGGRDDGPMKPTAGPRSGGSGKQRRGGGKKRAAGAHAKRA